MFVCRLYWYILLYACTVGIPSPVTQLSLYNVQCTAADIYWQRASHAVACGRESYNLSIVSIDPPDGVVETGRFFGTSYRASSLNSSSKYSVTVTTTNQVGDAPPSNPLIFTTMDELNYTSPDGKL